MTSLETVLTCTPCGHTVDLREEECKITAFFLIPNGGLRVQIGCAHQAIDDIETAWAVTISRSCANTVFDLWQDAMNAKKHA